MRGLRHQAVLYDGTDELLAATLPFLREAVEIGDPTIAVGHSPNVAAWREELGSDADAVTFVESQEWYLSPGKSFAGFLDFASAHPEATCVRMIGEPIWPVDWDAAVAEYAHYESVFNVIAADAPIWALCPYDVGRLPDAILAHAQHTHPEVRTADRVMSSAWYTDPDVYCSRLADRTVVPGSRARSFAVTSDLGSLRAAVEREALVVGVLHDRVELFLLAVHEAAANALTHGDGDVSLGTWIDEHSFVVEITDHGPGLSEAVAGYEPPDPDSERGRGLWLTRQICDLVEVQSRSGETRIRLHLRRPRSRWATSQRRHRDAP